MPKIWEADKERREKAKIPENLKYQSKIDIALEMIRTAVKNKISFSWITFDSLYGSCLPFIRELDRMNLIFVGDVKKDIAIFPEKPEVSIPSSQGKSGPKYRFPRPDSKEIQVHAYVKSLEEKDWEKITYRS